MPKIMHVIESSLGGSMQYCIQIANYFSNKGWDVYVVYSKRKETPSDIESNFKNVNLIRIKMVRSISISQDIKSVISLRKLMGRIQPDIVHLHSSKAGAIGRLSNIGNKYKLIYTPHMFAFIQPNQNYIKKNSFRILEWILAKISPSTVITTVSQSEYKQALKFTSKVKLLRNAVELPKESSRLPENNLVITVGRLAKMKNPMLVIDIIAALKKRGIYVTFVWVGDGELREEFERRAVKNDLNITVTGWVSKEEVNVWLNKCRIYLQPSVAEGMPLSLLEAMSHSRPTIVSNIEPHLEIIQNGDNGYIAKDIDDYRDYIIELLSSRELSEVIGEHARKSISERYNIDNLYNIVNDLYDELLYK